MHEYDVRAQPLGTIDLQRRNGLNAVFQNNEHCVSKEIASRNFLKGQAWKNVFGIDVLVPGRKKQTLGGGVTQPVQSSETGQKMYLMMAERLAGPRIHHAIGRRDDKVARNEKTGAPRSTSVAAQVDPTECKLWCALLINYSSIVGANDSLL